MPRPIVKLKVHVRSHLLTELGNIHAKHTVNWVNDHTQICDRLDERVQLMQKLSRQQPRRF